jgi:NAD(P)-dependent dehydrogenase (short-subunit alcohol dehydrogenase family)
VTGAAGGIGKAIAESLADGGSRVWCVDADADGLARTVDGLRSAGGDVRGAVCDVGRPSDIEELWARIDSDDLPVTGLVNNAGIFPRCAAADITPEAWDRVLSVNLSGTFFMSQSAARRMLRRGCGGAIVSLASGQAYAPAAGGAHYAASKAAIVNLSRALAVEWGSAGIRVNTVVPGLTDTAQPRTVMSDADLAAAAERIPLGRIGQPADLVPMVSFLLSDAAAYVTGQSMAVNGGSVMLH